MNKWQSIWEKKEEDPALSSTLSRLLAVDGYDSLGRVTPEAWSVYVGHIANRLGVRSGETIFDVGCGAGAFLWPLWQKGHPVGGLDYSTSQIERARQAMPGVTDFQANEAGLLPNEDTYDHVVACGTFLYFPDLDYAENVLARMVAKARKSVAILDVPDLSRKEEILQLRMATLGEDNYRQRYTGLDHLYYARSWFSQALQKLNLAGTIEDQILGGYTHSPYRFNVLAYKAG